MYCGSLVNVGDILSDDRHGIIDDNVIIIIAITRGYKILWVSIRFVISVEEILRTPKRMGYLICWRLILMVTAKIPKFVTLKMSV